MKKTYGGEQGFFDYRKRVTVGKILSMTKP